MPTTRIDMRIDESVKAAAEKAAALKGMGSLTEYVVRLIEEDSKKVIEAHEAIILKDDVFDRFMAACEAVDQPNDKLKAAVKETKRQGFE